MGLVHLLQCKDTRSPPGAKIWILTGDSVLAIHQHEHHSLNPVLWEPCLFPLSFHLYWLTFLGCLWHPLHRHTCLLDIRLLIFPIFSETHIYPCIFPNSNRQGLRFWASGRHFCCSIHLSILAYSVRTIFSLSLYYQGLTQRLPLGGEHLDAAERMLVS